MKKLKSCGKMLGEIWRDNSQRLDGFLVRRRGEKECYYRAFSVEDGFYVYQECQHPSRGKWVPYENKDYK